METVVAIYILPLFLGWRLVLMIFCMSTSHQLDVQIHFSNLRHLDGCRSRHTTGKRCASQCLWAGKQDGIPSQPLGIVVICLANVVEVDVAKTNPEKPRFCWWMSGVSLSENLFIGFTNSQNQHGSQITSSFSVRKSSLREKAASRLTSRDFFHGPSHVLQRFSWKLLQKILFYMILAVEKSASQSDIKKAYRTPWNIIQVWGRWSRENSRRWTEPMRYWKIQQKENILSGESEDRCSARAGW